jgi:hypothetical protein
LFIVFVLAVVGLLFAVSGERAQRIPEDELHAVIDNNEVCMGCHGPGKPAALKETHPPKYECIECHKVKRNRGR